LPHQPQSVAQYFAGILVAARVHKLLDHRRLPFVGTAGSCRDGPLAEYAIGLKAGRPCVGARSE
jgi:hypothetical protein